MNIAYYMPFKPLGHPTPSGDLILGTEIHRHLNLNGWQCRLASRLRCRWIYLHPGKLTLLFRERRRILATLKNDKPDLWLSYHCYYKAPDLLGPWCASRLDIPYVIFQGIYSTKRRRRLLTRPGFYLNRRALLTARLVFTNKRRDEKNLLRLLPPDRVCYIPPGIHTADFTFDDLARTRWRSSWGVTAEVVIMAAAMFRPGVKSAGLRRVMASCATLLQRGYPIRLVIVGDGRERHKLREYGHALLDERLTFCGQISRNELAALYSGADIFAFPGIEESLGMVYLEAQSCGLPVVAYGDWGAAEAVVDGVTGLLSPAALPERFTDNLQRLVEDASLRQRLGQQAADHVRARHEIAPIYGEMTRRLESLIPRPPPAEDPSGRQR
ncbi:MAG: glycosyltransferase family 4 protein [Desulfopila sp.]